MTDLKTIVTAATPVVVRGEYINRVKCDFALIRISLVVLFLFSMPITGLADRDRFNDAWNAEWIWTADQGPDNAWVDIRKTVSLSEQPETAVTKIAAENKYWLFVNGVLVVNDGGLSTRPDLSNTYFDTIDLAPYLKKGANTIAALVWHKGGPETCTEMALPDGGFLFQSDLTGAEPAQILSDRSWKIRTDPAFSRGVFNYKFNVVGTIRFSNDIFDGDPLDNVVKSGYYRPVGTGGPFVKCASELDVCILSGSCDLAYGAEDSPLKIWDSYTWLSYPVTYDARDATPEWKTVAFDDSGWDCATEKGIPPAAPWNQLVNRTIPFCKDYGLKAYENQSALPKVVTGNTTITGALGCNIQGTPYFRIDAPAGVHIRIILNEYYYQDYFTKEGLQEFECFAWQNSSGHVVKYVFSNVAAPVKIIDLKFRQTSYNSEILGAFHSNDEALNLLWKKCKNTSQVCMRDYFYDCPDRMRGQWWADVSEQILYSFYLYDQNATLLSKKAYRELLYTQKDDGSLYTTAPGTKYHLPDQNLAAMTTLWYYYLYTGDRDLLEELYPMCKKYIQYLISTSNADGMLILQDDVWNWIDWGDNLDIQIGSANTVCNAMYICLLGNMADIAGIIGRAEDTAYYTRLKGAVKSKFNDYFWNGKAYVFANKNGQQSSVVDDRSNAWAVLAGVVDGSKKGSVLDVLTHRYNAGPYQEMYVERAMLQLGPVAALKRMRERYKAMVDSWSSTLWEEFPAKNSNNHAWSAGPLYLLSAHYLGVKPVKAAYDEFEFQPLMGDLTKLSGVIPSPKGDIHAGCELNKSTQILEQTILVPPHSSCIVGIPKNVFEVGFALKEIRSGNDTVWEKGSAESEVEGIQFIGETGLFVLFRVQSGSYAFTAKAEPEP